MKRTTCDGCFISTTEGDTLPSNWGRAILSSSYQAGSLQAELCPGCWHHVLAAVRTAIAERKAI